MNRSSSLIKVGYDREIVSHESLRERFQKIIIKIAGNSEEDVKSSSTFNKSSETKW